MHKAIKFISKKNIGFATVFALLLSFVGLGAAPANADPLPTSYQTITGTVVGADANNDGNPELIAADKITVNLYDPSWNFVQTATYDATNGQYTFTNVATDDGTSPSEYFIWFQPDYTLNNAPMFSNGTESVLGFGDLSSNLTLRSATNGVLNDDAADFTAGQTVLPLAQTISGTVTNATSTAWSADDYTLRPLVQFSYESNSQWTVFTSRYIEANGSYSVSNLPVGNLRLKVVTPDSSTWASEWYENTYDENNATTIALTADAAKTINVQLLARGSVTGRVSLQTTAAGSATYVAGLKARLYESTYGQADASGEVSTNATGYYTISNVDSGSYNLGFYEAGSAVQYLTTLGTLTLDRSAAAVYTISAGTTLTKNAALKRLGKISGTLKDPDGVGFSGRIIVWNTADDSSAEGVTSAEDGTFEFNGLAPGNYKLGYNPSQDSPYGNTFWSSTGSVTSYSDATPITIAVGTNATGKNLDVQLSQIGNVAGTVKDSAGNPVAGVTVEILEPGLTTVGWGFTGDDGTYTAWNVPIGSGFAVRLSSDSGAYPQQYVNASGSGDVLSKAATIEVTGNNTTTVDAVVYAESTISGSVIASDQSPAAGVTVEPYDSNGNQLTNQIATVAADGTYTIHGLLAGDYTLLVNGAQKGFVNQWYNGAAEQADATTVTVGAEQAVTLDSATTLADLPLAALSGTITDPDGNPIAGAVVSLFVRYNEWDAPYRTAITDDTGAYRLRGVDVGSYSLQVATTGDFLGQWYQNADYPEMSTEIVVADATEQTGLDQTLPLGGSIHGQMFVETDNGPVPATADFGAKVQLYYSYDNTYAFAEVTPDETGSFDFKGLNSDNYMLKYIANGNYVAQWFGKTQKGDDKLTVTRGVNTDVPDVTLEAGSTINGSVLDSQGNTFYGDVTVYEKGSDYVTVVQTDDRGEFTVPGLPIGEYSISVRSYSDLDALDAASASITALGQVIDLDPIQLEAGAVIRGNVTIALDAQTNLPNETDGNLPDCSVTVIGSQVNPYANSAWVDQYTGEFTTFAMPTSKVTLQLDCNGYPTAYLGNKYILDDATQLSLTAGTDVNNVSLRTSVGGSISGTVMGDTQFNAPVDQPLSQVVNGGRSDVNVTAWSVDNGLSFSSITDQDGNYTIGNLPPGKYVLQFDDGAAAEEGGWYKSTSTVKGLAAKRADAKQITVTEFNTASVYDVNLSDRGSISGVLKLGANPSPEVCSVVLYDENMQSLRSTVSSAEDGSYTFAGVPSGVYAVASGTCSVMLDEQTEVVDPTILPTFYQPTQVTGGRDVTVGAGQDLTGIDISMQRGSTLTGTFALASQLDENGDPMLDDNGDPITFTGGTVTLINSFTSRRVDETQVTGGQYSFSGVPAGQYTVLFNGTWGSQEFSTFFYGGKATLPAATKITVLGGQEKTLAPQIGKAGITVSGNVTLAGEPVSGVYACAVIATTDEWSACGITDADGNYNINNLAAGKYKFNFDPSASGATNEWYNNKYTAASATQVTLADSDEDGVNDLNIDADLSMGAGISGQVLENTPFGNIHTYAGLELYDNQDNRVSAYTDVNGTGYFNFNSIAPGTYYLKFVDYTKNWEGRAEFVDAWYKAKGSTAARSAIVVTANQVTELDLTLLTQARKLANVSGYVTEKATGNRLEGAKVCLAKGSTTYTDCFETGPNGMFFISTTKTGSGYKLKVTNGSTYKASDWGGTLSSQSSTSTFTLTKGDFNAGLTVPLARANGAVAFSKVGTITFSGQLKSGQTLSAVTGTWDKGTKFKYQWTHSNPYCELECEPIVIKGATAKTYKLTTEDVGFSVNLTVTATLKGKITQSARSANFVPVIWGDMPAVGTPEVAGNTWVTSTLKANEGKWDKGTTFYYRWYSDASGTAEVVAEGTKADGANVYEIPDGTQGSQVWVEVGGANAKLGNSGAADAEDFFFGEPSAPVIVADLTEAPTVTELVGLSGTAKVGKSLSAVDAVYSDNFSADFEGTVTFSYSWLRCTKNVAEASTDAPATAAKCAVISGATKPSYKLTSKDKKKYIVVVETATSEYGSLTSYSAAKKVG